MKIAALLPHVEVFGGVRRYLEIGNELSRRGHSFVLFHPQGTNPEWLPFRGEVRPLSSLEEERFDTGLCSEFSLLQSFDRLKASSKFFYFVLEGHKKEKEAARRPYRFLGNSEGICRRVERKYGVRCLRAPGGVNLEIFHPLENRPARKEGELTVLASGRIHKRRKGVSLVLKALDGLAGKFPGLRLLLFDSLVGEDRRDPRPLIKTRVPCEFYLDQPQSKMAWLFSQADIFVSAERRAGWANTAAEAMACRLPVVCTRSGTLDFAFHEQTALVVPFPLPVLLRRQVSRLLGDPALRLRLAESGHRKIRKFSWKILADRLEGYFRSAPN